MKRMLINATQPEEIRLAMVDGQKLLNFEIEQFGREQRKGNIYKAVITRIEPSLEACFVDYGEERQGFLPFKEVSREYFAPSDTPIGQMTINEALTTGQELIVQVEKEERGSKNAALTTFVSLAGRYLVLMPNKRRSGGISRRVEGDERRDLRDAMAQLTYPRDMSIIARTAAIQRAANELQWDLTYLLGLWEAITDATKDKKGAFLIYNESALVIRAIRDYYNADVSEILIDTGGFYNQAQQFMAHTMPDDAHKVKFYQEETALFARFQIEKQIESAYAREVKLPAGGSIVLDHTEALVAVDVNSARATRGSDIEETATNTNLEAADEIARQLRLRDLGGLIVIDFIDMRDQKNRQDVENRLRNALKQDRARVQFSTISRFGLLELSRQRLRPALFEGASISCPRCNGTGHIRDTESTSLQILRRIQEEAQKDQTAAIKIQVPVDVTSFLLNKKREELTKIERNNNINIVLIPNKQLETPNYHLERLRDDDAQLEALQATYTLGDRVEDSDAVISTAEQKNNRQEPLLKNYLPKAAPAPVATPARPAKAEATKAAPRKAEESKESAPSTGFWGWLKGLFSADDTKGEKTTSQNRKEGGKESGQTSSNNRRTQQDRRNGNRSDNSRGERQEGRDNRGQSRDNNRNRNNRNSDDRQNDRGNERQNTRGNDRNNNRDDERDNNNRRNDRNDRRNGRDNEAQDNDRQRDQQESQRGQRNQNRNQNRNQSRNQNRDQQDDDRGQHSQQRNRNNDQQDDDRGQRNNQSRNQNRDQQDDNRGQRGQQRNRNHDQQDDERGQRNNQQRQQSDDDQQDQQQRNQQREEQREAQRLQREEQREAQRLQREAQRQAQQGNDDHDSIDEQQPQQERNNNRSRRGERDDRYNNRNQQADERRDVNQNETETHINDSVEQFDNDQDERDSRQRTRRTRDRYGRDRRQRAPRSEEDRGENRAFMDNAELEAQQTSAQDTQKTRERQEPQQPTQVTTAPRQSALANKPIDKANYILPEGKLEAIAEKAGLELVGTSVPVAKPAVQVESAKPAAKAPRESIPAVDANYTLPKSDLEGMAAKAGLQWVGTSNQRVQEVQEAIRNEPKPTLGRQMRSAPEHQEESLVMIETQKSLS